MPQIKFHILPICHSDPLPLSCVLLHFLHPAWYATVFCFLPDLPLCCLFPPWSASCHTRRLLMPLVASMPQVDQPCSRDYPVLVLHWIIARLDLLWRDCEHLQLTDPKHLWTWSLKLLSACSTRWYLCDAASKLLNFKSHSKVWKQLFKKSKYMLFKK